MMAELPPIVKRSTSLIPDSEGMAPTPFAYDASFFEHLRPDQVPRFLGALTDPKKLQLKQIPANELTATQNRVQVEKVESMRSGGRPGHPVVIRNGGKNYIIDGHHGAAADVLNKVDPLTVYFKDISEVNNAVKGRSSPPVHPIDGIVIDLPVLVKAKSRDDGRRVVEVEASIEKTDSEGDLILQTALLDSADSFVANGHLDIDHISELGKRLGIPNPESFIVGRPTEVKDIGDKRTSVVGEIMRSADGLHNPGRNRYDAFWDTFKSKPPIVWRASIYGFPKAGEVIDCSEEACNGGAWRYIIKGLDWRSLAFTRNPVNDHIVNPARIVTAKAFVQDYFKSLPFGDQLYAASTPTQASPEGMMPAPRNLYDAVGQYHGHISRECPHSGGLNSTVGFRNHFEYCCGIGRELGEVYAHALMYHLLLARQRQANNN